MGGRAVAALYERRNEVLPKFFGGKAGRSRGVAVAADWIAHAGREESDPRGGGLTLDLVNVRGTADFQSAVSQVSNLQGA